MIFPFKTDRRLQHKPWVNLTIIALNVVVFLFELYGQSHAPAGTPPWWSGYMLDPRQPHWYQFFTYQFLHSSWEHIGFNMLFLYIFGNSLEDRLGPAGYLCFYLSGGVVAGLGHSVLTSTPVLGASGAISAVMGAFLALFPQSRVTLAFWLIFFVDIFEVPSIWLILLSFGQDIFFQVIDLGWPGRAVGHVAFLAHISGNVFGFVVGMTLLATRVLPREPFDFLSMVDRWSRRRRFRALATSGPSPWLSDAGAPLMTGPAAPGGATVAAPVALDERQQLAGELRAQILRDLSTGDVSGALDRYRDLGSIAPEQAMPRPVQLDLANHAMNSGRYDLAAHAYESFLRVYPGDELVDQLRLVLGLIYARYLHDPDRARPLLHLAADSLHDPQRQQLAREILHEIGE